MHAQMVFSSQVEWTMANMPANTRILQARTMGIGAKIYFGKWGLVPEIVKAMIHARFPTSWHNAHVLVYLICPQELMAFFLGGEPS